MAGGVWPGRGTWASGPQRGAARAEDWPMDRATGGAGVQVTMDGQLVAVRPPAKAVRDALTGRTRELTGGGRAGYRARVHPVPCYHVKRGRLFTRLGLLPRCRDALRRHGLAFT